MISDSRKPGELSKPSAHDSGFVFRRINARARDAGLSTRFRAVIGASGMPHAELAERAPRKSDGTSTDEDASTFAMRALREFGAATGMPATTRVMVSATESVTTMIESARAARINPRRVIVDLSADRSRTEHVLSARTFSKAGFLVSTRLMPEMLDEDFLVTLGADYLHLTSPPLDFSEAADLRDVLSRVVRRKGRAIVGHVGTEMDARKAEAAGAWLTYGDFLAQPRYLC